MTMGFVTATEDRDCTGCGVAVAHQRIETFPAHGRPHWSATEHTAPCGLPCLHGRIMNRALLKSARANGQRLDEVAHTAERCPRCRTRAEIIAWRIDEIGRDARRRAREEVDEEEVHAEMDAAEDARERDEQLADDRFTPVFW